MTMAGFENVFRTLRWLANGCILRDGTGNAKKYLFLSTPVCFRPIHEAMDTESKRSRCDVRLSVQQSSPFPESFACARAEAGVLYPLHRPVLGNTEREFEKHFLSS